MSMSMSITISAKAVYDRRAELALALARRKIANKCDEPLREVTMQEGQACAKKLNCAYIETSAKMNSNVKEAFEQLLALEKRRNISLAPVADTQKLTTKRRLKNSCSTM